LKKLLSFIFTPIHFFVFSLILIIFHPIQWICLKLGGYKWHKRSVDVMNLLLTKSLLFNGTSCHFINKQNLPTDRPLILVANHNSLYDIAPFFWYLRKHHVKFISKIELGHGIPSVSFNLRHGGSVLIDRKNQRQSIPALKNFAQYLEQKNYAGVIFPEGTRSRTGQPKPFSQTGLKILIKYAPSAFVIPVSINNTWKLHRYGKFPLSFGERLTWKVHPPIDPSQGSMDEILAKIETTVRSGIKI
jgi:1-acyl-sn-glycerol-3-phosphate acyltransferase